MSTQWNHKLSGYVFLNVIECLEQNIQKQINCKKQSNTKQMSRVQNISKKNTKLLTNAKYDQLKVVIAAFISAYLYQWLL